MTKITEVMAAESLAIETAVKVMQLLGMDQPLSHLRDLRIEFERHETLKYRLVYVSFKKLITKWSVSVELFQDGYRMWIPVRGMVLEGNHKVTDFQCKWLPPHYNKPTIVFSKNVLLKLEDIAPPAVVLAKTVPDEYLFAEGQFYQITHLKSAAELKAFFPTAINFTTLWCTFDSDREAIEIHDLVQRTCPQLNGPYNAEWRPIRPGDFVIVYDGKQPFRVLTALQAPK